MRFTPFQTIMSSAIAIVLPLSFAACSASNPATSASSESAQGTESQPTDDTSPDSSCNAAIQSAQRQLEPLPPSQIRMDRVAVATLNQSPPRDRPDAYVLTLSAEAAATVMTDSQRMQSISADLIGNCPTVSLVAFGQAETDWSIHFGRMGNTQIEQFQCVNEPTQTRLPWGYQRCL